MRKKESRNNKINLLSIPQNEIDSFINTLDDEQKINCIDNLIKWFKNLSDETIGTIGLIGDKSNFYLASLSIFFAISSYLFSPFFVTASYVVFVVLFFINLFLIIWLNFPFNQRVGMAEANVPLLDAIHLEKINISVLMFRLNYYRNLFTDRKKELIKRGKIMSHVRILFICFFIIFLNLFFINKVFMINIENEIDLIFSSSAIALIILAYLFFYKPSKKQRHQVMIPFESSSPSSFIYEYSD